MRISDWSSDVCSSDFRFEGLQLAANILRPSAIAPAVRASGLRATATLDGEFALPTVDYQANANSLAVNDIVIERSEERRVGNECVSTCRSRWSPNNKKKKTTQNPHLTP